MRKYAEKEKKLQLRHLYELGKSINFDDLA